MSTIKPYKKGLYRILEDIKAHEAKPVSKIEPVAWLFSRHGFQDFTDTKSDWYNCVGVDEVTPLFTEAQLQQAIAEATAAKDAEIVELWAEVDQLKSQLMLAREPYLGEMLTEEQFKERMLLNDKARSGE